MSQPAAPVSPEITQFIEVLKQLKTEDRGALARLRRNAGFTLAEAQDVMGLFYHLLPANVHAANVEIYFLVATLYGLNDRSHSGNLGATMREVRAKGSESIDRRMSILLDSNFDRVEGHYPAGGELAFRLRQTVKMAAGKEVGINWSLLLDDLTWWTHPEKRVQKRWAKAYFQQQPTGHDAAAQNEEATQDAH